MFDLKLLINNLEKPIISKTILSAIANAKQSFNVDEKFLYISEARVDEGPSLKRFCPHAQGRGFPIKKRFSHIIIKLSAK